MANKLFGETLRTLRNNKGYTQQQVADMLNLKNKSTLGSWEVGKSEPDGYTFLKLCKIYEVKNIYDAFEDDSLSLMLNDGSGEYSFSAEEQNLIKKYRVLDERGRKSVDDTLDREYGFVNPKKVDNKKESE